MLQSSVVIFGLWAKVGQRRETTTPELFVDSVTEHETLSGYVVSKKFNSCMEVHSDEGRHGCREYGWKEKGAM